ncbi:hypothetical protein [Pseudoroseomonas sp. WGS1072]|uniref:hypothetical protein n=1 Tax=Roseomonas sp. WGS1072 TaxID=3366816 RepID=UPI003BF1BC02
MLALVSGNILFTSAFMLLRVPPAGAGVPINEAALVATLLVVLFSRQSIAGFVHTPIFFPLMVFWSIASIQLTLGVFGGGGIWAVRDAANAIEIGFLFVGYCLALDQRFDRPFASWFVTIFVVAALYLLLYPFQGSLVGFSPTISSLSGYDAAFLFSYGNPASTGVAAACLLIVLHSHRLVWRLVLTGAVVMTLIVFVQARIAYLQLVLLFGLIVVLRPGRVLSLLAMAVGALTMMLLFLASGIELSGRLGQTFSFDFLMNHIQAIWGGGDTTVRDAAEGVDLRLEWWLSIHERLQNDFVTFIFGLGYGIPLTSFRGLSDDIVREPHNSFVSIYGRLGMFGLAAFLILQTSIVQATIRVIRAAHRLSNPALHDIGMTILCFLGVHLIYSVAEGGFEVSFIAVPYYFFAGVMLAFDRRIRVGNLAPDAARLTVKQEEEVSQAYLTRLDSAR